MWRIRVVVGRILQYSSALVLRVRAQPVRYGSSRSSFVPRRFSHQVRFPCCRAGGFSRHTHFLRRVVARCKRCAPILEVGVQIALGMLVTSGQPGALVLKASWPLQLHLARALASSQECRPPAMGALLSLGAAWYLWTRRWSRCWNALAVQLVPHPLSRHGYQ
jgi:hypothetical protein